MSRRGRGGVAVPQAEALPARLDALEDVRLVLARSGFDLGEGGGTEHLAHARARLRHGADHTVVALVGSTGSGKSSLLNALIGVEVARAGVTRPTTSVTQAVTVGEGAESLLDLIGVSRRHHLRAAVELPDSIPAQGAHGPDADRTVPGGLVLLDLPDFDSVTVAHRLEVDRLITLVDLLVWVTDPQKYADESLHEGYLRRLTTHADVMRVVLNKVDTVPPGQVAALLADLSGLLAEDGLPTLVPIPTSTRTPEGVDALRAVLAEAVGARQAALDRIDADLRQQARDLADLAGSDAVADLPRQLESTVAEGLAGAAGVERIAALVAAQQRRDAALATGWPPLRWLRRIRRAPLAALDPTAGSHVAEAEVSRTLRAAGATAAESVGPRWAESARTTVRDRVPVVTAALDQVVSRDVQVLRQPPRWWRAVGALHGVLLLCAVVGGLWLGGLALAQALLLIDPEPFAPRVGAVPIPTLLLGGLVLGVVLGLLASLLARVGAARQGRRAVASLRAAIEGVARDEVIAPLAQVAADRTQVAELLTIISGRAR